MNVGAGAGSYEPRDRRVVALEPSWAMIRQRPADAARVVQGSAVALPFRDGAFAAALATLTVHHWPDRAAGLAELRRVARRCGVVLTWLPDLGRFWLVEDYFPELVEIDRRIFPTLDEFRAAWGDVEIHPVPIPHDCIDGFLGAYWRRPHAYLDPAVRASISTFTKLGTTDTALSRLHADLTNGTWHRRHADLVTQTHLDLGYRIIAARWD